MKRMWSKTLVVMGAVVLAGGLALAEGKRQSKPREEEVQSPQACEAECKSDVQGCTTLCKKRMKVGDAECARVCGIMAQECAKDCRQGGGKEE
ncbi:hypothetical protein F0U60_46010 [Archangium minus]|uniref:Uncharacterized protein n=1 Tax=Archangium minus TaxID=83450 RepID=A0ABY9X5J3_9BACT|nr:hypothetical protein F0U61_46140 [Archangium violaceum]WNG50670.1 hypothetical protein F0U60_46010 [Archangium minus]